MQFEIMGFVSSLTDIPILARLVRPGEGYGRFEDGSFTLTNLSDNECLLEFYDERERNTPHAEIAGGRFINRFRFNTMMKLAETSSGVCLDPAVAAWQMSGDDLRKVLRWATNRISGKTDVSEVTVEGGSLYETMYFAPDAANMSELHSLGRNGLMKTIGIEVDFAHPSILMVSPINSRGDVGRCEIRIPKDPAHIKALMGILQKSLDDMDSQVSENQASVA